MLTGLVIAGVIAAFVSINCLVGIITIKVVSRYE